MTSSSRDPRPKASAAAPEGLRARRRRETAQAIHVAAVRLVERHGYAAVTVDMISVAAGVSPRTFFNYFPAKEAALVAGPPPLTDEMRQRLAAGDPDPRRVLDDLVDALVGRLDDEHPLPGGRRHFRAMFRVASANPELGAVLHARFDAFESELTGVVSERLGVPAANPLAALITGIALSVVRVGLERWSADGDEEEGEDGEPVGSGESGGGLSPAADLRHVAALLRDLMPDQPR
ncbi:TetR/AcrR family transcriptional regulator [Streptomyces sp. NPDC059785]|uniref:TetR/AcrR family transcriptional regulator n=1 Tax=unclassified Streptomyces TaxID=2593676 RepID=UPI0036630FE6